MSFVPHQKLRAISQINVSASPIKVSDLTAYFLSMSGKDPVEELSEAKLTNCQVAYSFERDATIEVSQTRKNEILSNIFSFEDALFNLEDQFNSSLIKKEKIKVVAKQEVSNQSSYRVVNLEESLDDFEELPKIFNWIESIKSQNYKNRVAKFIDDMSIARVCTLVNPDGWNQVESKLFDQVINFKVESFSFEVASIKKSDFLKIVYSPHLSYLKRFNFRMFQREEISSVYDPNVFPVKELAFFSRVALETNDLDILHKYYVVKFLLNRNYLMKKKFFFSDSYFKVPNHFRLFYNELVLFGIGFDNYGGDEFYKDFFSLLSGSGRAKMFSSDQDYLETVFWFFK